MGKLVYATNTSIDGFTEDAAGSFDWSEPDEDLHVFYNDMMRGIGTQLLGRRMYETMAVWETDPSTGWGQEPWWGSVRSRTLGRRSTVIVGGLANLALTVTAR
jgi:dihydrofolate reductase